MKDGSPRILIIRLSAIGDVVRALPILHTLRDHFRDARIDWAVERKSAGIVEGHPLLDNLLVFERPAELRPCIQQFLAFCRQIRANRYDLVVDAHGIFKSGCITAFSGAKKRFGFARPMSRECSWLFTNKRVKPAALNVNRVAENLQLCSAIVPRVGYPSITVAVPEEVQDHVQEYVYETFDGGKKIVAVHAPVERPEKQWPLDYFAELCDLLLADGRFEVVLTWGPGQFDIAQRVQHLARRRPKLAPSTPDLKHYAWFINLADLYFGGDTGPMHIASAMGTPVVAVFGGTNPGKHGPYKPPCTVLYEPEPRGYSLAKAAERLRKVTPETAYDACCTLLAELRQAREQQATAKSTG